MAFLKMKDIEYKFLVLKQISLVFFIAMSASILVLTLQLVAFVAISPDEEEYLIREHEL